MSKIAENKALEAYPITNDMTDFQRQYERYAYLKGYDQAMQDFLEKACNAYCKICSHAPAEGSYVSKFCTQKDCNYIQNFIENIKNTLS